MGVTQRVLCCSVLIASEEQKNRRNTGMIMDRIALVLTIIGALNWGSIGLFSFDIVAWLCGGQTALLSRVIYTVIALAGVWCISLLFRSEDSREDVRDR